MMGAVFSRRLFPLFSILPSWVLTHRVHLWSEYTNRKGVKIQLYIEGQPKYLNEREQKFLLEASDMMLKLNN
jgi:hypothetical protein